MERKGVASMLPINVDIDRMVMMIINVSLEQWDKFKTQIGANRVFYPFTPLYESEGRGMSKYKYSLNFGQGEGAIRVDYYHNTTPLHSKEATMRIEWNPAKHDYLNTEHKDEQTGEVLQKHYPADRFWEILKTTINKQGKMNRLTGEWTGNRREIRYIDFAFDFPVAKDKLVVFEKKGKQKSNYKGTLYWGNKNSDGYMKIYDKKKERGKKLEKKYQKYDEITRVEVTLKFEQGVGYAGINSIKDFELSTMYDIYIFDERKVKVDSTLKAMILCLINGLMEEKDFSRRYREKIKNAFENIARINLDNILQTHLNQLMKLMYDKYIEKPAIKQ